MKNLISIFIMLSLSINLFGQVQSSGDNTKVLNQLKNIGVDNSPLLNDYESAYINMILKKSRKGFDFKDKKVGFITGSSGKTISNKENYFNMQKKSLENKNVACDNGVLYIFDENQKKESGGYDAAIVYWSKVLIPTKDVVKRLKNK